MSERIHFRERLCGTKRAPAAKSTLDPVWGVSLSRCCLTRGSLTEVSASSVQVEFAPGPTQSGCFIVQNLIARRVPFVGKCNSPIIMP